MNWLRLPQSRLQRTLMLTLMVGFASVTLLATDVRAQKETPKQERAEPNSKSDKSDKKKPVTAKSDAQLTAIVGAKVVTMGDAGTLEKATVLIEGSKIQAVGTSLKIPKHATVISADGMTLIPGLIDCRSSLWLSSDSVRASASDGSLKAVDAIDPFSDAFSEVAQHGVTTVCVGPKGSLGGQSAVLRVASASSTAELLVRDATSMQASIGLSGSTGNSRDRYLQYESLKKTFTSAKAYKESWDKYNEAIKKSEQRNKSDKKHSTSPKKGDEKRDEKRDKEAPKKTPTDISVKKPEDSRKKPADKEAAKDDAKGKSDSASKPKSDESKTSDPPKKPKRDRIKDILVRVLNKEIPLRIEAHRPDDVANALRLADDFDLEVTLEGVSQAGRTWDVLHKQHPALVVGPMVDLETPPSYLGDISKRYAGLSDFKGLLAIASFSSDSRASRFLRFHAAAAVAEGLKPEQALAAVTVNAARMLGIDDQTGTIEDGKLADLVVVAGDPLDAASSVMLTMSHGEIVFQDKDLKPASAINLVDVPKLNSLPENYALVSDRVLFPNGKLAPGAVWVRNGKIAGVKKAKDKTGKLSVIDMGSAVVTPGLVVGHFSQASNSSEQASAPQIRATDSLPPGNKRLRDLSDAGFTSVMYAPGSKSVLAGQIGCVRIRAKQQVLDSEDSPFKLASKFVLSNNSRSTNRFPASLSGQLSLVKDYLNGSVPADNLFLPVSARKLVEANQVEVLKSLKDRSAVSVIEAGSAAEVQGATQLAQQFDLKLLVLNPDDPSASLKRLTELQAGMIVRPAQVTDYQWYSKDIASASNAGMKLAVSGTEAIPIRHTLAQLVNAGMNREAALRAVTSDAAEMYGNKQTGRLASGALADIVIWNDSPLNAAARPIHIIVDGRLQEEQE